MKPEHLIQDTQQENILQAYRRGRKTNRGEHNPSAVLTEEKVAIIRKRLQNGEKVINLASEFGVHSDTIGRIRINRTWKI